MEKLIKVSNFINDIEYSWGFPRIIKYNGITYYLKDDDGAFIGYFSKSGINLEERIDIFMIYEDYIEIIEY